MDYYEDYVHHYSSEYNRKVFDGALKGRYKVGYQDAKGPTKVYYSKNDRGQRVVVILLAHWLLSAGYKKLQRELAHQMCHAGAWVLDSQKHHCNKWLEYARKLETLYPDIGRLSSCRAHREKGPSLARKVLTKNAARKARLHRKTKA